MKALRCVTHAELHGRPVVEVLYPEVGAGGFSRVDGNVEFFGRVNALIKPEMTVVDFGAGRGKDAIDDPVTYRRNLRVFKGRVAEVIGVDIDPVVLSNPSLDRAVVVEEGAAIPLADASVDLVFSDFCFEHLRDPGFTADELGRLLKPGGWICARTPNRWGYIGVFASFVPNQHHVRVLRRLQPARQGHDVFSTEYRINTRTQIRKYFPASRYEDFSYTFNTEPAYFGDSLVATKLAKLLLGRMPEALAALHYVFLRKRGALAGR
jgi:SAM-dependent methyltransferase